MKHRFAFVLDQQVGLRTQALNLETVAGEDGSIEAHWIPVHYQRDAGLLTRLPGLPGGIKGTLRGVVEIREGLKRAGACDAALWATWAAKSVPDLVSQTPAYLVMDMSPVQMEAMGALYGYSRGRAVLRRSWKKRATERIYSAAAHLFPWSRWVADSLCRDYGVRSEKVTPVCPGVDLNLFRPSAAAGPGDGITRILFVGGDFGRKGGDLLLRWAQETQVRSPWELHLVTRDTVPDLAHVVVHRGISNNSPELIDLYQRCDIFALPTRADCFSLVAMEAMACGLPVIISRLGGIPELIADGVTGHLVDPDDYPTLAAHLDCLVSDYNTRQTMAEAAARHAATHFDCRVNLGKILNAMKSHA